MPGELDLRRMLDTLEVERRPGVFTYATDAAGERSALAEHAAATVVEAEGTTLIVTVEAAEAAGAPVVFRGAWLTLTVWSSLEAVGLTAAVSRALADAGIPCNVLAGYHHDHLLVPDDRADAAVEALMRLRRG